MKIIFTEIAWEQYLYWQKHSKKITNDINALLKDISCNHYAGLGKSERLKYKYQGFWSRRINREHRLIYKVKNDVIYITKCRFYYG